jgi:hypothetical protein
MNAIRISRRLDSHIVDLPELTPLLGRRVEIIVLDEGPDPVEPAPTASAFGCGKGEIWMAPDFDETPEEFKDYM